MTERPVSENAQNQRDFLRRALKSADCIGLTYTSNISAFKESKWREVPGGSLIRYEYDEDGTLMLYFRVDHITVEWLKEKSGVFDFLDSDNGEFLWDLCLYKDGKEVFSSVTHERRCYSCLENS